MNRERLQRLIEAVENQPDNLFDIESWGRHGECGTIVCAFGAYILANPHRGLSLRSYVFDHQLMRVVRDGRSSNGLIETMIEFDICKEEARYLFCCDGHDDLSKSAVISRIRAFMAKEEASNQ